MGKSNASIKLKINSFSFIFFISLRCIALAPAYFELGISEKNSLRIYHQGVRDNENIKVLKCKKSGVFVLDDMVWRVRDT